MNKGNDESTSSSDSESDQDYVPSAKELRNDDDDDDDERLSERDSHDSDAEESATDREGAGAKRRSKSHSRRVRDKRRKVDVETAAETQPQPQPPSSIDDLWNEFKRDCGDTSKAAARSVSSAVGNETGGTNARPQPSTPADGADAVRTAITDEIAQKEERTCTNDAARTSCEFGAGTGSGGASTSTCPDSGQEKGAAAQSALTSRPAPSRGTARGGLTSALGQLNKKNKVSILERSKMDWDTFKQKEGIAEELRTHNKGKAGYLEKQDFLQRADLRQFEIEKAMRSSRRTKVLKPPGGGTSDIFGASETDKPVTRKNDAASTNGSASSTNGSNSNGSAGLAATFDNEHGPQNHHQSHHHHHPDTAEKKTNGISSTTSSVTASRGRVPPGGYSTGLW